MARRDARRPSRATIIILVLVSITLLTLDFRGGGELDGVRDGALDILSPVRSFGDTVASPFQDAWSGAFRVDDLEAEVAALRAQVEELEAAALLAEEDLRELEQVRELSGLTEPLALGSTEARVIDNPMSDFERTVEIDAGSSDGIAEGMPVVAPGGLIGRVVQVSGERALVQLLTDGQFGVGVRLSRSGATGVAEGQGRTTPLRIDLLADDVTVVPGETVLTSGQEGSAFPAGLVIGTVIDAAVDDIDGQLDVDVAPAQDLNRLDVVSVLHWPIETDSEFR